ncbi:MAG TPA: hypothetical protein ENK07_10350 [Bacteroidetes bacterium]|nr:hypothetical protein [Bacteroidota bacterium]
MWSKVLFGVRQNVLALVALCLSLFSPKGVPQVVALPGKAGQDAPPKAERIAEHTAGQSEANPRTAPAALATSGFSDATQLQVAGPLVLFHFEKAFPLPADARPTALAVDPRGWLYVTDVARNRVLRVASDGDSTLEVGGYGWGREQFDRPADVCAANGLDVYICDFNNNRLERYDKDLNFLASLPGHELDPPWTFGYPVSVAQAEHGDVFLAERENRRVIRFDALGQPVDSFGDIESGEGQLSEPTRLEIDGANRVVVVDSVAHRVTVFDFFGNYLGSYGQGVLQKPVGLACLGDSLVFVADLEKGLVTFYRGRPGTGTFLSGPPRLPVDLAVHGRRLFVLDAAEPQILRYDVDVQLSP